MQTAIEAAVCIWALMKNRPLISPGGGISILVGDGAISGLKIVKKAAWQGRDG